MALIACNCPSCGGKLEFHDDREYMFCSFCGTKVIKEQIVNITVFDTDNDKPADWFYDNVVELLLRGRERDADKVLEEFFNNYPTDERVVELREFYATYPPLIAEKGSDTSSYYFSYMDRNVTVRYNENGFVYDSAYNSVDEDIQARSKEITDAEEIFEYAKDNIQKFPDRIKEAYLLDIAKYESIVEEYKNNFNNISKSTIQSVQKWHKQEEEKKKNEETMSNVFLIVIVAGIFFFMCCLGWLLLL